MKQAAKKLPMIRETAEKDKKESVNIEKIKE